MKNYIYNTNIGTFEIRQISHMLFQLWMREELLGEYASAELAAEDVAAFDTDYAAWDQLKNELDDIPSDLSEWSARGEETPRR
jgi:hypothetical protein